MYINTLVLYMYLIACHHYVQYITNKFIFNTLTLSVHRKYLRLVHMRCQTRTTNPKVTNDH